MRLLHVMASRGLGGAETYSTDMILSLHKAGVDQCVVMSAKAPRYREMVEAGVRIVPDVLQWPLRFIQKYRFKKLIAAEKPDLIHCWMRRAASLVPAKMPGPQMPVIGWFGGYYDPKNFPCCTSFVGVTEGIVSHMVAKGVAPDKAHFIPTFPDIQDMPAVDRASLDTPAGAPVLLALSRLHQKKGLDILLRAAKQLPEAYVWLAGEGPLRHELEALTAELGLQDRVRFLGWRTDRAALLRAADVCVLPSRYEPFGTVILEAWAAKVPYVACASAGPLGHIREGVDGLLVPIDDVDCLAKALGRVIADRQLAQSMVDAGFDRYLKTYTREVVTERMMALYEKIIQKNG